MPGRPDPLTRQYVEIPTLPSTGGTAQITLSRWRHGFESRTGCQEVPGQSHSPEWLFPFPASVAHGLPMNHNDTQWRSRHAGIDAPTGVGVGAQGLPGRRPGQREAALCHEDGPRRQARGAAAAERDEGRGRARPGDEDDGDRGGAARPLARARSRGLLAEDDPRGRRVHRAQPASGARRRAAEQADQRVARPVLPLAARRRRPERLPAGAGHDPAHPRDPASGACPGSAVGLAGREPGCGGVTAAGAAAGDRSADAYAARQVAEGDRRERSGVRGVRPRVGDDGRAPERDACAPLAGRRPREGSGDDRPRAGPGSGRAACREGHQDASDAASGVGRTDDGCVGGPPGRPRSTEPISAAPCSPGGAQIREQNAPCGVRRTEISGTRLG